MTEPTDISPDDNALAAEFSLGLLPPEEVAAFEARLRREPALVAVVTAWQAEFATLAETEVTPVTPPAALQGLIETRLFGDIPTSRWSPTAIWRGLALTGIASTVTLGALLVFGPVATRAPDFAPSPALVAQLAPVSGQAQFVALFDRDVATLRVQQAAGTPAPQRAQELWLIIGDNAPVSLGLLSADGTTVISVDDSLGAALEQAVLAVSDEPPGGSPTGAPTGDILAAGPIFSL